MKEQEYIKQIEFLNNKCNLLQSRLIQAANGGTVDKDSVDLLEEVKVRDNRIKDLENELATARSAMQEVDVLRRNIMDLQQELATAKSSNQEAEELRTLNDDLKNKLSILTEGHSWKSAVDTKVYKKYKIMARVICYMIQGYSTSDIMEKLYQEGVDVCQKTIYRALSVKADEDKERVEKVLILFPEIFEANHVSDESVWKWFSDSRVKKLHLVAQKDLVERYGEEIIRYVEKDKYTTGDYYKPEEINRYLQGNSWGDTSL